MASLSQPTEPAPEDFAPLAAEQRRQQLSRPSLSYWQDAWIRLRANRRAIISLYIVIGMLMFTLLGPLVWRVDPSAQDLDQVSRPPGAEREVTLTDPYRPWNGEAVLPARTGLRLAYPANTQAVRLIWDPVPGAQSYLIYRNIVPNAPGEPLGLPIAQTLTASETRYEDRLDLRAETYFYTVAAVDASGADLSARQALSVTPVAVITVAEAVSRGLQKPSESLKVGDTVRFALHPLGTDYLGRDMLARLMHGARVSLFLGIVAPLLFVAFGVAYGSLAGFLGGRVDQIMMRFADFVIALPFLLFMILFKIAFGIGPGQSGILPMIVALVMLSWPGTARLVRGQILQVREEGYVNAARLLGARTDYLVLRHMIPNTMGVILVTLTFAVPSAIFTEAFLSFIGMGVAPP
ncbi:MAG: ABC transporter permease subunit, partial [Phenylobacterium sp.]